MKEIEEFKGLEALRLEGNTVGVEAAQAIAKALETKSEFKVCGVYSQPGVPILNLAARLGSFFHTLTRKCDIFLRFFTFISMFFYYLYWEFIDILPLSVLLLE